MLRTRILVSSLMVGLIVLITLSRASEAEERAGSAAPAWFEEHADFMTRGSGIFHADNSAYRSEESPWDAYGLHWEKGPSGRTLRGRLFGLQNGQEKATFWEFYSFWHPEEGKAYVYQVARDGTVGIGAMEPPDAAGRQRLEQTFQNVDGEGYRSAHIARNTGDTHYTESFVWSDGKWKPRRTYLFKRVN